MGKIRSLKETHQPTVLHLLLLMPVVPLTIRPVILYNISLTFIVFIKIGTMNEIPTPWIVTRA